MPAAGKSQMSSSDYAPAWVPEPDGARLAGPITRVDTRITDRSPDGYPVITVQTQDGPRAFHGYHVVAKNELAKHDLEPGDQIEVVYDGKMTGKSNRTYNAYTIVVVKGEG
jgi:hypothetical protein